MSQGRVVADGPTGEIRARVGTRTIRATVPGADLSNLTSLPGVAAADRRGDAIVLICSDADAAIRALLDAYLDACDLEITSAAFEDAFIELTGDANGTTAATERQEALV
jgi:ABC-2 type transport system ATP-binding protein